MGIFHRQKLISLFNWISFNKVQSAHIQTGFEGEQIARQFLKKNKFRILKTNYSGPHGEIDIIAQEGPELVFIEVKTRSAEIHFTPESAVDKEKKKHIIKTATNFIDRYRLHKWPCRYDIIAIVMEDRNKPTIRHIRNAFNSGSYSGSLRNK